MEKQQKAVRKSVSFDNKSSKKQGTSVSNSDSSSDSSKKSNSSSGKKSSNGSSDDDKKKSSISSSDDDKKKKSSVSSSDDDQKKKKGSSSSSSDDKKMGSSSSETDSETKSAKKSSGKGKETKIKSSNSSSDSDKGGKDKSRDSSDEGKKTERASTDSLKSKSSDDDKGSSSSSDDKGSSSSDNDKKKGSSSSAASSSDDDNKKSSSDSDAKKDEKKVSSASSSDSDVKKDDKKKGSSSDTSDSRKKGFPDSGKKSDSSKSGSSSDSEEDKKKKRKKNVNESPNPSASEKEEAAKDAKAKHEKHDHEKLGKPVKHEKGKHEKPEKADTRKPEKHEKGKQEKPEKHEKGDRGKPDVPRHTHDHHAKKRAEKAASDKAAYESQLAELKLHKRVVDDKLQWHLARGDGGADHLMMASKLKKQKGDIETQIHQLLIDYTNKTNRDYEEKNYETSIYESAYEEPHSTLSMQETERIIRENNLMDSGGTVFEGMVDGTVAKALGQRIESNIEEVTWQKRGQKVPSAGQEVPSAEQKVLSAGQKLPSVGQEVPSAGQKVPSAGQKVPSAGQKVLSAGQKQRVNGPQKRASAAEGCDEEEYQTRVSGVLGASIHLEETVSLTKMTRRRSELPDNLEDKPTDSHRTKSTMDPTALRTGSKDKSDLEGSQKSPEIVAAPQKIEPNASSIKTELNASSSKPELNASSIKTEVNASSKKTEVNTSSKKTELNTSSRKTDLNASSKKTELNASSRKTELIASRKTEMNSPKRSSQGATQRARVSAEIHGVLQRLQSGAPRLQPGVELPASTDASAKAARGLRRLSISSTLAVDVLPYVVTLPNMSRALLKLRKHLFSFHENPPAKAVAGSYTPAEKIKRIDQMIEGVEINIRKNALASEIISAAEMTDAGRDAIDQNSVGTLFEIAFDGQKLGKGFVDFRTQDLLAVFGEDNVAFMNTLIGDKMRNKSILYETIKTLSRGIALKSVTAKWAHRRSRMGRLSKQTSDLSNANDNGEKHGNDDVISANIVDQTKENGVGRKPRNADDNKKKENIGCDAENNAIGGNTVNKNNVNKNNVDANRSSVDANRNNVDGGEKRSSYEDTRAVFNVLKGRMNARKSGGFRIRMSSKF